MEYRIAELEKKIRGVETELSAFYSEQPDPAGRNHSASGQG